MQKKTVQAETVNQFKDHLVMIGWQRIGFINRHMVANKPQGHIGEISLKGDSPGVAAPCNSPGNSSFQYVIMWDQLEYSRNANIWRPYSTLYQAYAFEFKILVTMYYGKHCHLEATWSALQFKCTLFWNIVNNIIFLQLLQCVLLVYWY